MEEEDSRKTEGNLKERDRSEGLKKNEGWMRRELSLWDVQ